MTPWNATTPDMLATLPIQATGSGVADLEIAYEQMELLADDKTTGLAEPVADAASDPLDIPTESGDDAAESAAHPS